MLNLGRTPSPEASQSEQTRRKLREHRKSVLLAFARITSPRLGDMYEKIDEQCGKCGAEIDPERRVGKTVVWKAGEAYDARDRGPNRKFRVEGVPACTTNPTLGLAYNNFCSLCGECIVHF